MSEKINNHICDGCNTCISKQYFTEYRRWYIIDKTYCPKCCKLIIHKQVSRAMSLRPQLRYDAILTILGLKDDISHMLDAVVLTMVNRKIKTLIKKDKEDDKSKRIIKIRG